MISVITFTSVINQMLPEPHAGLLNGILFGTKATISKELTDALITTGTLHIVALSGMNITILTNLIASTLLWFVGRRAASVLAIVVIAGFVWFVGASPSIVRAGIMGSISLIAIIFGRQYWGLLTWILAISTMLLLNPSWISDVSFQLSALATLGIIMFGARPVVGTRSTSNNELNAEYTNKTHHTNSYLRTGSIFADGVGAISRSLIRLIADDLRLTLAAQVFTIPIILWYFHRISLISPLANVLIGWMIQPLTVVGLLAVVLGWVLLPLGQVFAWGAWVGLEYLILVVTLLAKVPGASIGG